MSTLILYDLKIFLLLQFSESKGRKITNLEFNSKFQIFNRKKRADGFGLPNTVMVASPSADLFLLLLIFCG